MFNWLEVPVIYLRPTLFLEWLLYPWQLSYLQHGILRMPAGRRHSPIAVGDQGRAIAALLKHPEGHIGTAIDLSGPIEMDHEQMAAELSEALGRKTVFQDPPSRNELRRSPRWVCQLTSFSTSGAQCSTIKTGTWRAPTTMSRSSLAVVR